MIIIKPVKIDDFDKIIEMLQSISNYFPKKDNIIEIWDEFVKQDNLHAFSFFYNDVLIGYGSFLIEIKIRGGKTAHFEDIIVHEHFRGKGMGKKIIKELVKKSTEMGCYKISLSCKEHNVKFYNACGFINNGVTMTNIL